MAVLLGAADARRQAAAEPVRVSRAPTHRPVRPWPPCHPLAGWLPKMARPPHKAPGPHPRPGISLQSSASPPARTRVSTRRSPPLVATIHRLLAEAAEADEAE